MVRDTFIGPTPAAFAASTSVALRSEKGLRMGSFTECLRKIISLLTALIERYG
jgi:hypothetical protein